MTYDEYIQNDPRRLAQKAVNDAAEDRRRIAKDENATMDDFDAATNRLREAQANLRKVEKAAIKNYGR